jgi:hypothetical protein
MQYARLRGDKAKSHAVLRLQRISLLPHYQFQQ